MTDWRGKTVVIVPCYNEALRLNCGAFREFARQYPSIQFLLVNDGSTDETSRIIEELRSCVPQSFTTMHLAENVGKAEAVRRGINRAFLSEAKYVGFWDADLATPLKVIDVFQRVLRQRPETDMVFGVRLRLLGHEIHRSLIRGMLGRIFSWAVSLLLSLRIRDTQCGAKLFRNSETVRSLFQEPFQSRWIFDVELVSRLVNAQRHQTLPPIADMIYEQPLDEWREIGGSSVKGRDFCRATCELGRIYWQYLRPGAEVFPVNPTRGESGKVQDRRRHAA